MYYLYINVLIINIVESVESVEYISLSTDRQCLKNTLFVTLKQESGENVLQTPSPLSYKYGIKD